MSKSSEKPKLTADSFQFTPPRFPLAQINTALEDIFGIQGDLKPLEGERDQNFRVTASDGTRFVLKISAAGEEPDVVDFQIQALEHMRKISPEIPVPVVQPTRSNGLIDTITSATGERHMIRMLSYLEGVPLSMINSHSPTVAKNTGVFQGRVAKALSTFHHRADHYFLVWDINNGLVGETDLWRFGEADICEHKDRLQPHFAGHVLPALTEQRRQVIHSDAHHDNLLIEQDHPDVIAGLIDFGDMVRAPLVCDAAILALGFVPPSDDPVQICAATIAGFNEEFPLTQAECDLLYDTMLMREVLTVLLSDFKISQSASNSTYVEDTRRSVIKSVNKMISIGKDPFKQAFNQACGYTQPSGAA